MDMRNGGGGFGQRRMAPVKMGDEIDVHIEAVGEKGDGIAKKNGFVIFVPNAKEGDNLRVRVTKVMRSVGFAEVVGQASGPVESGSAPRPKREEPRYESQDSDDSGNNDQPDYSDSEDFGEEDEQ
jgi:predicted RNA-binding protein with TRAM domain